MSNQPDSSNNPENLPRNLLIDQLELGMDAKSLADDIRRHFNHTLGCDKHSVSTHHAYQALVLALRDRLMERWKNTHYSYQTHHCKRTFYLSMEFLMGRSLGNNLLNLGITEVVAEALQDLGLDYQRLEDHERDAGLGNGGLGRLAACFLDSCATLQLPVMGYCIRYDYGIFRQLIENGEQIEKPDHWLLYGNPWELERPEFTQIVRFGGRVEYHGKAGDLEVRWLDTDQVLALPYDIPVPGYRNGTVNTLRLWQAVAVEQFDLERFNAGYYLEAVSGKAAAEAAVEWIRSIAAEPEVGAIYNGKVVKTVDFGAFVNFMGSRDGLVHISEISKERVGKVTDVIQVGDTVKVKLIGIDDRGKVKLSMRAVDQETGADVSA